MRWTIGLVTGMTLLAGLAATRWAQHGHGAGGDGGADHRRVQAYATEFEQVVAG
ncbi:MAG: hypothetical protein HYU26_15535, partial [Candidatus Rokubacteria bacterium]|nr:hypothetical protein [Candidatus Rokubacteria bacterium]